MMKMGGQAEVQDTFAPDWLAFENELGFRPLLLAPLPNMLAGWDALGAALVSKLTFPAPDTTVHTEDREIGSGVVVRIYTPPTAPKSQLPVGLFIHGGGWAMGDLESDDSTCRRICKETSTIIVSTSYRLAPAHPYPAALDDCFTALEWAISSAASLNCTPDRAFILGSSAGGNLAIGTALKAIDSGLGNKIVGLVGIVPVTIHPDVVPEAYKSRHTSYDEHATDTVNSKSAMGAFFDAYGPAKDDIYASPLLHPKLASLPRTYLCWCQMDTLRDDGRVFKAELEKQGVPIAFDEFVGYPHYFWSFPSKYLKGAEEHFYDKLLKGVNFVLAGGK